MTKTTNTRERLVETAARLFHEQGFVATGVGTILREADVNSGSLYHFFESKEALLAAVLDRYLENLRPEILARAEAATDDPVERVFALLNVYRQGLTITRCGLGCPIGNLALEASDTSPAIRERIDKNFDNWCLAVEQWLREAGGRLPASANLAELSRFVLVVMEGAMMQARASKSLAPFDAAVAQLRRYFEFLEQDRAGKPRPEKKKRRR